MIEGIAGARGLSADEVRRLVDEGPFLPEDALAAGLVDGLAYADELKDREPFEAADWREIADGDYRQIGLQSLGLNQGERIALIYAVGAIVSGSSGFDVLNGDVLGSDTLTRAIRSAREDDSVRAIVLRIDSPGGSAVASDVIWREVGLVRESGKPIVASMSDLAASGGYYIAMGADAIVAQPATLTGSIGVVFGKFTTGGTYEKLGVGIEPVSEGRFAEIYSPVTRFSDAERAKAQQHVDAIYGQFVAKAAEGRGTTPDALHEVAQGRVWTGRQALEHGLIDEVGGLGRGHRAGQGEGRHRPRRRGPGWWSTRARGASSSCSTKGCRWPGRSGPWRGGRRPRPPRWAGRPRRRACSARASRWRSCPARSCAESGACGRRGDDRISGAFGCGRAGRPGCLARRASPTVPLAAQPTRWDSAPLYGADSTPSPGRRPPCRC